MPSPTELRERKMSYFYFNAILLTEITKKRSESIPYLRHSTYIHLNRLDCNSYAEFIGLSQENTTHPFFNNPKGCVSFFFARVVYDMRPQAKMKHRFSF